MPIHDLNVDNPQLQEVHKFHAHNGENNKVKKEEIDKLRYEIKTLENKYIDHIIIELIL